jgi:hypothetical protein
MYTLPLPKRHVDAIVAAWDAERDAVGFILSI